MAVAHNGKAAAACLRCGAAAPREDQGRLRGTSCGGEVARLPGRVLRELAAGSFDEALWAAPEAVRVRAQALGWRPLGEDAGQGQGAAGGAAPPPPGPPPGPPRRPGEAPRPLHERRAGEARGPPLRGVPAQGGIIAALFGQRPAGPPARALDPRGIG